MDYSQRRNFEKTSEPPFRKGRSKKKGEPVFVIQEHDASTHHFDFRLEVGEVLKSWAVPKGPSTNPKDKRLAVATEDHPLDYADFEGVIPQGEYGGGRVIVWDTGPYENHTQDEQGQPVDMEPALRSGHARIFLKGKKLSGSYSLVHSKMRGDERNWLLIKTKDEHADARRNPVRTEQRSVLSDRSIDQVEEPRESAGHG